MVITLKVAYLIVRPLRYDPLVVLILLAALCFASDPGARRAHSFHYDYSYRYSEVPGYNMVTCSLVILQYRIL